MKLIITIKSQILCGRILVGSALSRIVDEPKMKSNSVLVVKWSLWVYLGRWVYLHRSEVLSKFVERPLAFYFDLIITLDYQPVPSGSRLGVNLYAWVGVSTLGTLRCPVFCYTCGKDPGTHTSNGIDPLPLKMTRLKFPTSCYIHAFFFL